MTDATGASDTPSLGEDAALSAFARALATDFELLAALHDRELTPPVIDAARQVALEEQLSLKLASSAARDALAAFDACLSELPATLEEVDVDDLASQYADVYLRHTYRASPTESVWQTEDGLERQEPMFLVEQWYRRHNLKVEDWAHRPADHLVIELRFLSYLAEHATQVQELAELARFMDEHPLLWLDKFAAALTRHYGPPVYVSLAHLTAAYLDEIRDHLAAITGIARPVPQPRPANSKNAREKTCADADERPFVPGSAPSW